MPPARDWKHHFAALIEQNFCKSFTFVFFLLVAVIVLKIIKR